MSDSALPDLPSAAMARRALQFIFCVDCSGSMAGDRIASLNYAARSAIPAMRAAAEDNPEVEIFVRVLAFADKAEWRIAEPTSVANFAWADLAAGGETNMGLAMHELARALSAARMPGRQMPPVLVLLSDGLPTDDADAGLAALARSDFGDSAVRIAIAIGADADRGLLQSFIGRADFAPLQANNAETLINHIKWAASVPVKAASTPIGAVGDAAQSLAVAAGRQNEQIGEVVW